LDARYVIVTSAPAFASVSPLSTATASGTVCSRSDRRRAVMMISPPGLGAACGSAWGSGAGAGGLAAVSSGATAGADGRAALSASAMLCGEAAASRSGNAASMIR